MDEVLTQTDLKGALPLVTRGKVRDLYALDDQTLLFVATDRISAYDVVMKNGIPQKGSLLTLLTRFWFNILFPKDILQRTHFISLDIPRSIPSEVAAPLKGRCMQVRKLKVFPIEAIVRGYITGSAWKEYQQHGTVHGIKIKAGLRESEPFPGGAIYTPSTKAEAGEHDENIHPEKAAEIVGPKYAQKIEQMALDLYNKARDFAMERGIIIADTKFEFGLDEATDEIVLVDEILTPDSSRFWPLATYKVGQSQESFDKQSLRDWLTTEGLKGKEGVEMPEKISKKTSDKYHEAFERITGKQLDAVLAGKKSVVIKTAAFLP